MSLLTGLAQAINDRLRTQAQEEHRALKMKILDSELKFIQSKIAKISSDKINTLERLINDHKNDKAKSPLLSKCSDGRDLYERKLNALQTEDSRL